MGNGYDGNRVGGIAPLSTLTALLVSLKVSQHGLWGDEGGWLIIFEAETSETIRSETGSHVSVHVSVGVGDT